MTSRPYPAELYELVHRGTEGDLAFYRGVCARTEPPTVRSVLELGCGYGRVLEGLRDPELELTGLEIDPALLRLASDRLGEAPNVRLVQGDMRAFDARTTAAPAEGFDRILIPHSAVYCLPDDASCVACFRCCGDVLASDGRLVFDAYGADAFHRNEDPADHVDERLEPVVSVDHEGTVYDVFERSRWEPSNQRLDVTYEYIPRRGGEVLQGRLLHRYLLQEQLAPLVAAAGLHLESLHGDWRGTPAPPESEMWVATVRRPDAPSRS